MKPVITFDDSARPFILNVFGKTVDSDGFIVEKNDRKQRVLTPRGDDIRLKEFAGIRKGSAVFIKSDIVSLVETADVLSKACSPS